MDIFISPISLHPVNLVQVIYLSICLFGLILVSRNTRINSLCIVLLLAAVLMVFNLLEETGETDHLHLVTPVFTLGFGPALYWFCHQLVYNKYPDNRQLVMHLSPLLLALPFTNWPQVVIALGSLSQIIYFAFAIHLINRYHKVAHQTNSNAVELSIPWMTKLLAILLVMMLQDLVRLNLQPFLSIEHLQTWYFINTCLYAGLISYLIIMSVRQPHLFNLFSEFEFLSKTPRQEEDAADADANSLFLEIDKIIRTRNLYQQPRFSLRDLATETGIHEKNLSWIINMGAQKNFSEYINQLRVEAVCGYLVKNSSSNLLDLAHTAGFSSKSTFNAAFKKQTGMTPSKFCKEQEKSPQAQSAES